MDELLTITQIARTVGKPDHVVNHAIKRHGPTPTGRVGIARVWHRDQLPAIKMSLQANTRTRGAQQ